MHSGGSSRFIGHHISHHLLILTQYQENSHQGVEMKVNLLSVPFIIEREDDRLRSRGVARSIMMDSRSIDPGSNPGASTYQAPILCQSPSVSSDSLVSLNVCQASR